MNHGSTRKITNTTHSNTPPLAGINSQAYEYEIHRLCQEQILKQQRKCSHVVSCRYLKSLLFFFVTYRKYSYLLEWISNNENTVKERPCVFCLRMKSLLTVIIIIIIIVVCF